MTSISRDAWQDPLSRLTTVSASKALEAAEVIHGFAGSWAAAYAADFGSSSENQPDESRAPNPQRLKISRLGQPGFPEINFAPYSYGTNRVGPKGGSLLGHPISFSVVGPTLRCSENTWDWIVTDNSGLPDGDFLDLNAGGATIADVYGITSLADYPGGLYLTISQTGDSGTLGLVAGGVGDGATTAVGNPPLSVSNYYDRFEIFRVVAVGVARLTLDPTKRLSSYFTFAANPGSVRAIMIMQPAATRLVAIPEPGVDRGHERLFAIVPPARALNQDEQYSYVTWSTAPNWSENWLVDPMGASPLMGPGVEFDYKNKPALPIPRPKGHALYYLHGGVPTIGDAGTFVLDYVGGPDPDVGDLIHVTDVQSAGGVSLLSSSTGMKVSLTALMGWFEVVAVNPFTQIQIRRMEETDPETGRVFFGTPELLTADVAASPTEHIELKVTIHKPIHKLWWDTQTENYFDFSAVESARVKNIIDPQWVEGSGKKWVGALGTAIARADRAIFDTRGTGTPGENADPGSLMDLGFRMVLFPATVQTVTNRDATTTVMAVPDWNRPITSNEVLLDPNRMGEKQYVEIDYSNGLVRLSHAPQPGSDVWPTSVLGLEDNPRGELVLFASCIPYSMEAGQLGSGVRVTASIADTTECLPGGSEGSADHADTFSRRHLFPLFKTIPQTITCGHSGSLFTVVLDGYVIDQIPPSGLVELLWGDSPYGEPLFKGVGWRGSLVGYTGVELDIIGGYPVTKLRNCYGGGHVADVANINGTHPAVAVWRREYQTPQGDNGVALLEYAYDTTYGAAKRASTLRFEYSELKANLDGSVSVVSRDPRLDSEKQNFGDLFSSALLSGGDVKVHTSEDAGYVYCPYTAATVLKEGARQSIPSGVVAIPKVEGDYYVYFDSTGGSDCMVAATDTALPLPDPEDIGPLARVTITHPAGWVSAVVDTRYFLRDVDRRVDLYVGQWGSYSSLPSSTFKPHFQTLGAAISYANEIAAPVSGSNVRQVRIFVVGPTREKFWPIPVLVDGLTIESAGRVGSGVFPDIQEIVWGQEKVADPVDSLFDIKTTNNLTFRNLSFRYDRNLALHPAVANLNGAFVFKKSVGGDSSRLTIENCQILGTPDGLLATTGGATLSQFRIRDNVALSVMTSFIYSAGPICFWENSEITGNIFMMDSGLAGTPSHGLHMQSPHIDLLITRNVISGFQRGVYTVGEVRVTENYVEDTDTNGIYCGAGALEVSRNCCENVYTDPGTPGVWWAGVYVQTSSAQPCLVEHNYVVMPSGWAPSVVQQSGAIVLLGATTLGNNGQFRCRGNRTRVYTVAPAHVSALSVMRACQSNLDSSMDQWYIWGAHNEISNNNLSGLYVNFDLYGWFSGGVENTHHPTPYENILFGNMVLAATATHTVTYLSHKVKATYNVFGGGGVDGQYGLYVAQRCSLSGNQITHLKDYTSIPNPTDAESLIARGNEILNVGENMAFVKDTILVGDKMLFQSNRLPDIKLSGDDLIVTGNLTAERMRVVGDNLNVTGNSVWDVKDGATLEVSGNDILVTGNQVGLHREGVNQYTGLITVTGTGLTVVGNQTTTLTISGDEGTVQGNKVWDPNKNNYDACIVGGTDLAVSGNMVQGTLVVLAVSDSCTLQGNRVKGNAGGDIRVEVNTTTGVYPEDLILVGNSVQLDILCWDLGAGPPAAIAAPAGLHYVALGNRVGATVFTQAVATTQLPAPAALGANNIT